MRQIVLKQSPGKNATDSFLGTYVVAAGVLLFTPSCHGYLLKNSRGGRTALSRISFYSWPASAFANNSKISPDLQALMANSPSQINVIVQYNRSRSNPPEGFSAGLLGGVVGTVINLLNGVLNTVFSLIPAVSATLHPSDILAVSNQANVSYISLDRPLGASLDYSAAAVGAPMAWSYGLDGEWHGHGSDRQRDL